MTIHRSWLITWKKEIMSISEELVVNVTKHQRGDSLNVHINIIINIYVNIIIEIYLFNINIIINKYYYYALTFSIVS